MSFLTVIPIIPLLHTNSYSSISTRFLQHSNCCCQLSLIITGPLQPFAILYSTSIHIVAKDWHSSIPILNNQVSARFQQFSNMWCHTFTPVYISYLWYYIQQSSTYSHAFTIINVNPYQSNFVLPPIITRLHSENSNSTYQSSRLISTWCQQSTDSVNQFSNIKYLPSLSSCSVIDSNHYLFIPVHIKHSSPCKQRLST